MNTTDILVVLVELFKNDICLRAVIVNNNCCYCWSSHIHRIVRFEDMSPTDLLRELRSESEEIIAVNKTFAQVLLQVCKVYRRQIYNLHRYKNTKSYLKSVGYTLEEADTLAKKINTGNFVYDNMGIILW